MTARLLLARMPGPPEQSWPLLLRACGAYKSFIRTHGGATGPAGLPARYVSGYLHADPSAEPGQPSGSDRGGHPPGLTRVW